MTVGDRIALIADGDLVEQGSTRQVYEAPAARFTAEFIGENNLFDGAVASLTKTKAVVDTSVGAITVDLRDASPHAGDKVAVSIRSELLELAAAPSARSKAAKNGLRGTFIETVYLGLTTSYRVRLENGAELNVRAISDEKAPKVPEPGAPVQVTWKPGAPRLHLS